jgi:hypothetical protein
MPCALGHAVRTRPHNVSGGGKELKQDCGFVGFGVWINRIYDLASEAI